MPNDLGPVSAYFNTVPITSPSVINLAAMQSDSSSFWEIILKFSEIIFFARLYWLELFITVGNRLGLFNMPTFLGLFFMKA